MKERLKKIKLLLQLLRALPVLPGISWQDQRFVQDLHRWKEIQHMDSGDWLSFAQIMWGCPEFRNLFIYRNRHRVWYRWWIALWYRPMESLYIQAKEIGGGLYIQHGFATMISAESIGENCWINQQVTIGYNGHGKAPVIGNDVMITCGAKVLGEIHVGNRAVIGANAVVIRDVEADAVMGGVPARRLK